MSLDELREKIDQLDEKLVELLNRRVEIALEIGKAKSEQNGEVYVPAREKQVLDRVAEISSGPLDAHSIHCIYREIMSASLALERHTRIAYLGPEATFTHQAARARFGGSVKYIPQATISDVFNAVEKRSTEYGVVPIENSTEGAVTHTLDQFTNTDLKICAEIHLSISHHLMAGGGRDKVKRIFSNPQVFGQCRHWLHENMPHAELIPISSTAKAAERAREDEEAGAIASDLAAELYGLSILDREIQDIGGNTTRFLVIGKEYGAPTGNDRTSIVFAVKHQAGALYEALRPFEKSGLNMTKIESRPSKTQAWEYYFFVDFEGHAHEEHVAGALKELEPCCTHMTVLGSYPRVQ